MKKVSEISKQFTNKVVIVTGGSSGIGLASAMKYATLGAKVAILARDKNRLMIAAREIREQTGSDCLVLSADVSNFKGMTKAINQLINQFGSPDILVHCAGINIPKSTFESTVNEFEEVIRVNLLGTFIACKLVASAMVSTNQEGCILLISSVQAMSGGRSPQYSASKAGIHGLAKSLARELAPHNIRVLVLAPGATETEFGERYWTPDVRKRLIEGTLMKRLATEDEISELVVSLTSKISSYMTGTVIHANGGFRLD